MLNNGTTMGVDIERGWCGPHRSPEQKRSIPQQRLNPSRCRVDVDMLCRTIILIADWLGRPFGVPTHRSN